MPGTAAAISGSPSQAQRNVDRAAKLLELKAGSQAQLEQARQELAVAEAAAARSQVEVERLKDLLEDDLRVPADPTPGDVIYLGMAR